MGKHFGGEFAPGGNPESERRFVLAVKMSKAETGLQEIEEVAKGLGLPKNVIEVAQGIALEKSLSKARDR